jgi:2,4-dienoyl-CoA reductase-like NADH-dependent reductase (Old Yellow Enzyme family)
MQGRPRRNVWGPRVAKDGQTTCRAMNKGDKANLVSAFTRAAWRAKQAGQFLSLALNQQTDEYGGTRQNRVRFLLKVVRRAGRTFQTLRSLPVFLTERKGNR